MQFCKEFEDELSKKHIETKFTQHSANAEISYLKLLCKSSLHRKDKTPIILDLNNTTFVVILELFLLKTQYSKYFGIGISKFDLMKR